MSIYDVENHSYYEPHSIPMGLIKDAAQVGFDSYFIAHETGIYTYSYSNNSLFSFISGVDADQMLYDEMNQELIVVIGSTATWYDMAGDFVRDYVHSSTITAFHLLYNK